MFKRREKQKKPRTRGKAAPARQAALDALLRSGEDKVFLDESLQHVLGSYSLSGRDRNLAMEIAYGTTRFRKRLDFVLNVHVNQGLDSLPPPVIEILRLSVYQIQYLTKTPDFAVVNDAVELTRRAGCGGLSRVVNGVLRSILRGSRSIEYPQWEDDPAGHLEVVHSHPPHLVETWLKRWPGEKVHDLCRFNNQKASVFGRINRLPPHGNSVSAELLHEFPPYPSVPNCVCLDSAESPVQLTQFSEGRLTIQDPAAMLVAPLLAPEPGMRVWDVCAAPGGKCTHMAELMDDRGTIVGSDLSLKRLKAVQENTVRLKLNSVKTVAADGLRPPWKEPNSLFDGVLLDVPCTGWGTFRRHPVLRWRLHPNDPERLGARAFRLLSSVSGYVRPGGVLVYSTCTLSEEENEAPVRRFLECHPDWAVEPVTPWLPEPFRDMVTADGWIVVFPPDAGTDGLFAARLRRNG